MTDFDRLATIRRIISLYRERGKERTRDDIDKLARAISKHQNISEFKALEAIEEDLIDKNPRPEKWD